MASGRAPDLEEGWRALMRLPQHPSAHVAIGGGDQYHLAVPDTPSSRHLPQPVEGLHWRRGSIWRWVHGVETHSHHIMAASKIASIIAMVCACCQKRPQRPVQRREGEREREREAVCQMVVTTKSSTVVGRRTKLCTFSEVVLYGLCTMVCLVCPY